MVAQGTNTLNSLLRGELAATETYQQALAKVGQENGAERGGGNLGHRVGERLPGVVGVPRGISQATQAQRGRAEALPPGSIVVTLAPDSGYKYLAIGPYRGKS